MPVTLESLTGYFTIEFDCVCSLDIHMTLVARNMTDFDESFSLGSFDLCDEHAIFANRELINRIRKHIVLEELVRDLVKEQGMSYRELLFTDRPIHTRLKLDDYFI